MSEGVVASSAGDVPDNFVPRDNIEMERVYRSYVAKLVMRHNRVTSNYADLLQHIWLKLIEADVLGKYNKSLGHLPKALTAQQACTYLKMPLADFMSRVHAGLETEVKYNRVFARDDGQCHRCDRNGNHVTIGLRVLKDTDPGYYQVAVSGICEQLGVGDLPERLWVLEEKDGQDVTTCLFCARHLKLSVSYKWYPIPQKGHWKMAHALYAREDVERLRLVLEAEVDRPVDVEADPSSVLSKSLFKQYLARAVHNFYANWCRTRDRRYKESYKGYDETTGRHWEETLGDHTSASQETLIDLNKTVKYLAGRGDPEDSCWEEETAVISLIESGKSAQEIARRQGIRPKTFQALVG